MDPRQLFYISIYLLINIRQDSTNITTYQYLTNIYYHCKIILIFLVSVSLDIDECKLNICERGCVNSIGSYQCSCPAGYQLALDGHHCEGRVFEFIYQPIGVKLANNLKVTKVAFYYPSIMLNTSERLVQLHIRLAFNEFTLTHVVWNTCNRPFGTRSSMRQIQELGHLI